MEDGGAAREGREKNNQQKCGICSVCVYTAHCRLARRGKVREVVDRRSRYLPGSTGLPDRELILSSRAEPPALIFASRRSRRIRACFWEGDSSVEGIAGICGSDTSMLSRLWARELLTG